MSAPLEFHPLANLFPLIDGEEFAALAEDIRANGLREEMWIYEGKILDGRNRYRACHEIGRDPHYMIREYRPAAHGDPLVFVLSKNLHRRHLTTAQRAAIAAELATMKQGTRTDLGSNEPKSLSNADAAKALKVSKASVKRAKQQMREDPEAHEKAKAGTLERKKPSPRVSRQESAKQALAEMAKVGEPVEGEVEPSHTPPEPFRVGGWPGAFSGGCRQVLGLGGLAGRKWTLDRSRNNRRDGEPAVLSFTTPSGNRPTVFEIMPTDVRALAKALVLYADWLEGVRRERPVEEVRHPAPEPVAPATAPAVTEPDDITELRAWAQSIGMERLAKQVPTDKVPASKLEAFLSGRIGSYHLHRALRDVRDDLAEGESQ